jgi:glyoxylase-like metal-dependent hydrolase (beta-lactamase superfamily II)
MGEHRMSEAVSESALAELCRGPVRVLLGERGGRYPDANSLLVEGANETLVIDPSLGMIRRGETLPRVDRVFNSHCHEDHFAANYLFGDVPLHLHELDLPGIQSLDGLMAIYGLPEPIELAFRELVVDQFNFTPRADALALRHGDEFDLGGVRVRVLHTPGHTRGHCCFLIDWPEGTTDRRLVFLGDIDLTSFGPYYGDAWSSLADFQRTLAYVREIEADWYVTSHHIGLLEGRDPYLERLDRF